MDRRSSFFPPRHSTSLAKISRSVARTLIASAAGVALAASFPQPATAQVTRTVTLGWTAPGNDGSVGTASAYSMRYSSAAISEANWASATAIAGPPVPQAAGTPQSMTAGGFTPGQTYYFALKAVDLAGNWSPISNLVPISMPLVQPFVSSCVPVTASASSNVNLTVSGQDFLGPDSLWLQRAGGRIVATSITTPSAIQVKGTVALGLSSTGYWDLVVKNPDGKSDTLVSALYVMAPAPTVTSITPAGGTNNGIVSITSIIGTNFVGPDSVFLVKGGTRLVATGVNVGSSTQISCSVNLTGAPVGAYDVQVKNADGQSASLPAAFTVSSLAGAPGITSITPAAGIVGQSLIGVAIVGTAFSGPDSVILIQGASRMVGAGVSTPNSTHIFFNLSLVGVAPGGYSLRVKNADGQFSTLAGAFTVTNPSAPPTVSSMLPAVAMQGKQFGVQINGTNFIAPDSVYAALGATRIALTGVSAAGPSQLGANLSLAGAPLGSYSITVKNPDGQSATLAGAFSVVAAGAVPTLSSVTPASGNRGQVIPGLQLGGTGFSSPDSVILSQAGHRLVAIPAWVQSSSQITATLDLNAAYSGVYDVTVKNGDGNSVTRPAAFTVFPKSPVVSALAPATAPQGAPLTGALVSGQGFWSPDSVVLVNGNVRLVPSSVQLLYPTLLSLNVDLTAAPAGSYDLRVINPDGLADTLVGALTVTSISAAAPVLTSVTPASGLNNAPLSVTFGGVNFTGIPVLQLQRTGQSPIVASSVSLVGPTQASGTFDLQGAAIGLWDAYYRNPDGQASAIAAVFQVNPAPVQPVLTSISPTQSSVGLSGVSATLTGSGFVAPDSVWIQLGAARRFATGVNVDSPTQIHATFDFSGLAAGSYDVAVRNPGGLSDTLPVALELQQQDGVGVKLISISPPQGVRGTSVHIGSLSGSNFTSPDSVWLSRPASGARIPMAALARLSSSQIAGDFNLAGAALGAWNVVLRNGDGLRDSLVGAFQVLAPPPALDRVTPSSGRRNLPVLLALGGANFFGANTARLHSAGRDISLGSVSTLADTSVSGVADITGAPTGFYDVIVANADGQSDTLAGGFQVRRPRPAPVSLSSTHALNHSRDLSLGIRGTGLDSGDSVSLVLGGQRILGTGALCSGDTTLLAHFDLLGAAPGVWSVEVRNGEGEAASAPQTLTIAAPQGPELVAIAPGAACISDSLLLAVTSVRGLDSARPDSLWIQSGALRRYGRLAGVDTLPGSWLTSAWMRVQDLGAGAYTVGLTDEVGFSSSVPGALELGLPSFVISDAHPRRSLARGQAVDDSLAVTNDGLCPLTVRAASPGAWMTVLPESLSVAPGATLNFRLRVSAVGLPRGSHGGLLRVSATSGSVAAISLAESLLVQAPVLAWSPGSVRGRALAGRPGEPVPITLTNTGDLPLHFTAASEAAWTAWSVVAGSILPGQSLRDTVRFDAGALPQGRYTGRLSLATDDSAHATVFIADTLDVSPLPDTSSGLGFDSLEVHLSVHGAGGGSWPLSLRNRSASVETWSVVWHAGWIRVQPSSGSLPAGASAPIQLSFDFAGLGSGAYRDTLTLRWGNDSTRWARLPVHIEFTADDASPLVCPAELSATWLDAAVDVRWSASADLRVERYRVYRRESSGGYLSLGFVSADSGRFLDASADTATGHTYRVNPVDARGVENEGCSEVRLDAHVSGAAGLVAGILGYPNPFAAHLRVRVDVPPSASAGARVMVAIFDAGGRKVRTLLDETRSPGRYVLEWDAHNGEGLPVVAGLYRVALEINGQRAAAQWLARRWTP